MLVIRAQTLGRVIGAGLAILALGIGGLGLSGSAPAADTVTQPPFVELTTWQVVTPRTQFTAERGPIIKGHTVGLFIEGGYCANGPKPEFDHVKLVELPKTKVRPFRAAIITAYRVWPEQTYTPAPITGPDYGGKCASIPRTIFHRVKTKRPAKRLRLYDGYYKTPHQVWPPVKR